MAQKEGNSILLKVAKLLRLSICTLSTTNQTFLLSQWFDIEIPVKVSIDAKNTDSSNMYPQHIQ